MHLWCVRMSVYVSVSVSDVRWAFSGRHSSDKGSDPSICLKVVFVLQFESWMSSGVENLEDRQVLENAEFESIKIASCFDTRKHQIRKSRKSECRHQLRSWCLHSDFLDFRILCFRMLQQLSILTYSNFRIFKSLAIFRICNATGRWAFEFGIFRPLAVSSISAISYIFEFHVSALSSNLQYPRFSNFTFSNLLISSSSPIWKLWRLVDFRQLALYQIFRIWLFQTAYGFK